LIDWCWWFVGIGVGVGVAFIIEDIKKPNQPANTKYPNQTNIQTRWLLREL
jgi:hypothetical protein